MTFEAGEDFKFSVSEVYGPVVQGEGALIGLPTIFVRFGGCDYRCSWCDSLYAVLPAYRATWEKLTANQILTRLRALNTHVRHVTFSGGNPAIQPLQLLIEKLQVLDYTLCIETQGTVAPRWLREIDQITVSPKPPSSGNITDYNTLYSFLLEAGHENWENHVAIKIVVFNDEDYAYARSIFSQLPEGVKRRFMQTGTVQDHNVSSDIVAQQILQSTKELQEKALADPVMHNVRVLPQLHAVLHGLKRGI